MTGHCGRPWGHGLLPRRTRCTQFPIFAPRPASAACQSAIMTDTAESCSVVLYKSPPAWGLPSLSVACTQVEVSGLPLQHSTNTGMPSWGLGLSAIMMCQCCFRGVTAHLSVLIDAF